MLGRKLSALQDLVSALPKDIERNRAALPFLQELQQLQSSVSRAAWETVQEAVAGAAPSGNQSVVKVRVSDD